MSGIKVTYRSRIPQTYHSQIPGYTGDLHAATQARIHALQNTMKTVLDGMNNQRLSDDIKEVSKKQEGQKRLQAEIDLLQTQHAEYAFASVASLEKQGYQIKETFTEGDLRVVFEKIDDPKNKMVLTVKPRDAEGTSWQEELEMSSIAEDKCFDIVDLYDLDMKEYGFTKDKREIIRPHVPHGKEREKPGSQSGQRKKIGGNAR
jgi:hypothetical protein